MIRWPAVAVALAAYAVPAQALGLGPGMLSPAGAIEPVGFQGRIPTESSPIWGERRLAEMRRTGRLPDTFMQGGCRYNLAGDPAVAYYVKECGRLRR